MMSFWVVALQLGAVDAVLLGDRDVEGEQPGGGRVDRHRGVHLVERDAVEQRVHVALVDDRDADLADLAAGEDVVGVVSGLGRQVEGDREAGLALGEVAPVELVRAPGVRMPGVGAHHPGTVGLGRRCSPHAQMIFAHLAERPVSAAARTHLFDPPVFRVRPMSRRLTGTLLATALAFLALATSAGAALIGIYRNPMETSGQRAEAVKLSGERCARGGSDHAFRIAVGKRTKECSYRTPVIGRDLEISATMRLLSETPKRPAEEGLPGAHPSLRGRRPLPARRLSRAAQDPAPQDVRRRLGRSSCGSKRTCRRRRGRRARTSCGCAPSTSQPAPTRAIAGSSATSARCMVADFTDRAAGDLPGRRVGLRRRRDQERQGRGRQRRRCRRPRSESVLAASRPLSHNRANVDDHD